MYDRSISFNAFCASTPLMYILEFVNYRRYAFGFDIFRRQELIDGGTVDHIPASIASD